MLPFWLDLLLTSFTTSIILMLGLSFTNLKISIKQAICIVLIVASFNVISAHLIPGSFGLYFKIFAPILLMIYLYSRITNVNFYVSSLAITLGFVCYTFIESTFFLLYYNISPIFPENIFTDILINVIFIFFVVAISLILIIITKYFKLYIYNLSVLTGLNNRQYRESTVPVLMILSIPLIIFILGMGSIIDTIFVSGLMNLFQCIYIFFSTYCILVIYLLKKKESVFTRQIESRIANDFILLNEELVEAQMKEKDDYFQRMDTIRINLKQRNYHVVLENLNVIYSYMNTHHPAENIKQSQLKWFLQSRYYVAQALQVDFMLHADEDLEGIESYIDDSFVRMLKYIYDNAFEAVTLAEFKEVYTEIVKEKSGFTFIIKNNGMVLPNRAQNQLFLPGYTTKGSPDRGYGLYQAKLLVDYYEGTIDIRGSDGYTQVTIKLPLRALHEHLNMEHTKPQFRLIKG